MTDAAAREIEDDAVGGWVVAGLADELDGPPRTGRRQGDPRGHPRRFDDAVADPADGRPDDNDHRERVRAVARTVSVQSGHAATIEVVVRR